MIYLDHNATTPVDKRVAKAMEPFFGSSFGNPSCSHKTGREAKTALEKARAQVAGALGALPEEIFFISGGTEANNWVIKGLAAYESGKGHIITTAIEHPSVINPCLFLKNQGIKTFFAGVDQNCVVKIDEIKKAIQPDTFLVSVMHANNETGTVQPIEEIAKITGKAKVLFHVDAAQSIGKIPINVHKMGLDFLSVAGHKLYGPKGIGVLFIRQGVKIEPLIHGASQEHGKRAGTENVAMAVGLGLACEMAASDMDRQNKRILRLTNLLYSLMNEKIKDLSINGHPEKRLPNTLSVVFPGVTGSDILEAVPDICVSTGSACHDRSSAISHVLAAMGVDKNRAMGTVRFSLGRHNTQTEIEKAAKMLVSAHERLTRP